MKISAEATDLSDAFKEYILEGKVEEGENNDLFEDMKEEDKPNIGFKYRTFKFSDGKVLLMRCQVKII